MRKKGGRDSGRWQTFTICLGPRRSRFCLPFNLAVVFDFMYFRFLIMKEMSYRLNAAACLLYDLFLFAALLGTPSFSLQTTFNVKRLRPKMDDGEK